VIDFNKAIDIARVNVHTLVPQAKNIVLEGAVISDDDRTYEITYSYDIEKSNQDKVIDSINQPNNLWALANLIGKRREYKVFIINAETGKFKGFKKYKED
jgi:hypothetical protein